MNNFMVLTFSLDFMATLFVIALAVTMSSSLSLPLSSYSWLWKIIANDHVDDVSRDDEFNQICD